MLIQFKFDGAVSESKMGCDIGVGVGVFINNEYQEDISKFVGIKGNAESSSNVAEWLACIEAFKLINEYKEAGDVIEVYSDSQLITNQFNGEYAIREDKFKQYYFKAKLLANKAGLDHLLIKWVKREFNKEADKLSKLGLKELQLIK